MPRILISLNAALARETTIDGRPVMTAIGKRSVEGRRRVQALGIEGDEQADLSVHGGLGKAVYAYPSEHYPFWETVRAQAHVTAWGEKLEFGALGENLTLAGAPLESEACVGDLLRFPDCTLAVSEPRYPCFKFNAAMGFKQASKAMVAQGWCGYHLAVRVPGSIAGGESFEWVPGPREVTIAEIFRSRTGRRAER
jgi:MOSC domain-containing protein YiiM